MHFHLPKPLHGWREFLGEVGIIVIGVLIALAAEQVVEELRWDRQLVETRKSLDSELADDRQLAIERIVVGECARSQLKALSALTNGDSFPDGIAPWKIPIGLRLWGSSAWDAAAASGVVAHMSLAERNRYAQAFELVRGLADLHRKAFETINDLGTLNEHLALTDVSRDRLQMEIARVRGLNSMMRLGSQQLIDHTTKMGIHVDADGYRELVKERDLARKCPFPRE